MTIRDARRAMRDGGIVWSCDEVKVPTGWNSTGCIAWRSKRQSRGENHDTPAVREMFEAEGESVEPIGEDCEWGDPTVLFQFSDGEVFGANSALVNLLDGMDVRATREYKTIMLIGAKNGRNEIVIAERRVQ